MISEPEATRKPAGLREALATLRLRLALALAGKEAIGGELSAHILRVKAEIEAHKADPIKEA